MSAARTARVADIVTVAARMTGIDKALIVGHGRKRYLTRIRFAVCIVAQRAGHTSCAIARRVGGRDHSTINNAISKAEANIARDPEYRAFVDELERQALSHVPFEPAPAELVAARLRDADTAEHERERVRMMAGSAALKSALHRSTNPERDMAIAQAYRGGLTQRQLAQQFGLSHSRIAFIIKREGVQLPREELNKRCAAVNKSKLRDPAVCAKISETAKRMWANGTFGRGRLFDGDPIKREQYLKARRYLGADEARRQMGIAA